MAVFLLVGVLVVALCVAGRVSLATDADGPADPMTDDDGETLT